MQKYKNYIYYTYYVKNCENNTGISFTSSCISCHLMDVQYCAHQSTPHFFIFCLEESRSDSYRRETGRKGSGLSNYTRTGFKISDNSSYAEMNLNVKSLPVHTEVQQCVSTAFCKTRWRLCHRLALDFRQ